MILSELNNSDALRNLVPFVQLKKLKNLHGVVKLIEQLQAET